MVSAEGIESALKQQTKDLTEHSWQFKESQVYGEQQTDFRNHSMGAEATDALGTAWGVLGSYNHPSGWPMLNPNSTSAPSCTNVHRIPKPTDTRTETQNLLTVVVGVVANFNGYSASAVIPITPHVISITPFNAGSVYNQYIPDFVRRSAGIQKNAATEQLLLLPV